MSKKKSIYDSGTTKGAAPRTSDKKRYDDNWEKIFGKKKDEKEPKAKELAVDKYKQIHIKEL
mgnify:FL=1